MIRNLLYNCCPLEKWSPQVWRDNVTRLRRYRSVFNGRRLVIIRTGEDMAPVEEVKSAFSMEAEFIELPNDPVLCEVSGFIETLGHLHSLDPQEIIFYAHTKGISHHGEDTRIYTSIERWRNRMYYECLRAPEKIDSIMSEYAACGCHLDDNPAVGLHFPGTFFWVNSKRLFSTEWRRIQEYRNGVEYYLGDKFPKEQFYSLYTWPLHVDLYRSWFYWESKGKERK